MKWPIIYADPPWRYSFSKSKSREVPYRTETVYDMCQWPVREIVANNALCFMWATWPKLDIALQLLEAWGFVYTTNAFVWRKLTKTGKEQFGAGYYTRSNTEVVLLGKRGKGVPIVNHSVRQIVNAPVLAHSRKPEEVGDRINDLVGNVEKLELFARDPLLPYTRNGDWMCTGLECDGCTIENFIEINKAMEER